MAKSSRALSKLLAATSRPQEEQSDSVKQVGNSLRTDREKGAYKLAQSLSQSTIVKRGKHHSWCRNSSGKAVLHHASDLAQSIQAAEGWRSADVLGAVRRNVICRPREKASRSKCATGAFSTSLGKALTSLQQGSVLYQQKGEGPAKTVQLFVSFPCPPDNTKPPARFTSMN